MDFNANDVGYGPPVAGHYIENTGESDSGVRIAGLFQFITGIWLMHCTYAMTVNLVLGAKAWI